ncbi:gastrula zinc finger protein xFG20-1-like [Uranotaenia lowii]|uniref:gastrula zinc finger protein xFG20-1-like n=1 Tax=Uranotaenia lowii TaxID=190385 RepID=UPI00247923C9|nr:gastrula zinc finger protein xFG20-1-like [Uranotaenia lowii]XP_055606153.1 gastrula zinc finger protein xFG20-1-like [Uranotaenia lowii]
MNQCRLCLGLVLVVPDNNIQSLKPKLETVFSFEILPHQALSAAVCEECVEKIGCFYKYAIKVKDNQFTLFEALAKNLPSIQLSVLRNQPSLETTDPFPGPSKFQQFVRPQQRISKMVKNVKRKILSFDADKVSAHLNMKCAICKVDQLNFNSLINHIRRVHGQRGYISCCSKKLITKTMAMRHLLTHNPKLLKRPGIGLNKLNETFKKMWPLFVKDLQDYKGDMPNLNEACNGNLEERKKMLEAQDFLIDKLFDLDCDVCDKKLSNQTDRQDHFKTKHPDVKYFIKCCGKQFDMQRSKIIAHMINHRRRSIAGDSIQNPPEYGKDSFPISNEAYCDESETVSAEPLDLENTLELDSDALEDSEDVPEYTECGRSKNGKISFDHDLIAANLNMKCFYCEKDQHNLENLWEHIKIVHQRRRVISCCGKTIKTRMGIMKHLAKHTKQKNSDNTYWQDAYEPMWTLFAKELEEYDGIMPDMALAYEGNPTERRKVFYAHDFLIDLLFNLDCDLCNTKLETQDERRKHFKADHPDTTYFISCCGKRYAHRLSIMNHMSKHRRNDTYEKEQENDVNLEDEQPMNTLLTGGFEDNSRDPIKVDYETEEFDLNPLFEDIAIKIEPIEMSDSNEENTPSLDSFESDIEKYLDMKCDICNEDQSNYEQLKQHFQMKHNLPCYIVCCGTKLYSHIMISGHAMKHLSREKGNELLHSQQSEYYSTMLTDFKVILKNYTDSLPNIERAMTGDETEVDKLQKAQEFLVEYLFNTKCELCEYQCESISERKTHFAEKHPEEKYFSSCCGQRFHFPISEMIHLNQHWKPLQVVESEMSEEIPSPGTSPGTIKKRVIKCFRCNFEAQNHIVLRNHFNQNPLCSKGIKCCSRIITKRTIFKHLRSEHKHGDYFICHVCQKQFTGYKNLEIHYQRTHDKNEGEEPEEYPCTACHKMFPTEQRLKNHIRGHEKMDCEICGLSYTRFALKNHILNKHKQGKEMQCEHCDKVYYTKYRMNFHLKQSHRAIYQKSLLDSTS